MILKSFELNKLNLNNHNSYLFYGENEGFKDEVIKNVSIRLHPADKIYRYKKYLRSVKIHDGNENIISFLKKLIALLYSLLLALSKPIII